MKLTSQKLLKFFSDCPYSQKSGIFFELFLYNRKTTHSTRNLECAYVCSLSRAAEALSAARPAASAKNNRTQNFTTQSNSRFLEKIQK